MNAADWFRMAYALDRAVRANNRAVIQAIADRVRSDGHAELADRIERDLLHADTTSTLTRRYDRAT